MSAARVPETVDSTDGVTIRVHDLGGSGPVLLVAHATGFCGRMYEPMAEVLGRRFHCIAFDFRAHGASTRPTGSMAWDGMADDVLAVAAVVSPDAPVAAVGHSMGGAALILAESARPGTLARAWTYEPILFEREPDTGGSGPAGPATATGVVGPDPSPISEGARRRRAVFASRREALERWGSRPPLSQLDERVLRLYAEHGLVDLDDGTVALACRPEDEAATFEHHHTRGPQVVGRLGVPLRIAVSGDGQRPAEAGRAVAAANPDLELVVYEDLTHFGPLEAPQRLADDVLAWLG